MPIMISVAMKYFLIFTLLAFLCVIGFMPILQYIIGAGYREGLRVVPIVMAAEIMMGIYFNLSFWYKLIDKTIYGALFSIAGCAVLFGINLLFIPRYGYMACAWGGFAGYGIAMVLSYVVGQIKNPIRYPMAAMCRYTLLALVLFAGMQVVPQDWHMAWKLTINSLLLLVFAAFIVKQDVPLQQIKQKFLKRNQ